MTRLVHTNQPSSALSEQGFICHKSFEPRFTVGQGGRDHRDHEALVSQHHSPVLLRAGFEEHEGSHGEAETSTYPGTWFERGPVEGAGWLNNHSVVQRKANQYSNLLLALTIRFGDIRFSICSDMFIIILK